MESWRPARARELLMAVRCALPFFVALSAGACVDINGGAVEVPWAIFTPDGRAITDCACALEPPAAGQAITEERPIAYVRLDLVSASNGTNPCLGLDSCRFTCGRKIGATPFMIPEGQYEMSLVPLAEDGTVLAEQDLTPVAPVSRPVTRGQPTELEAFAITATCASRCNGGSATQPCTGG